MSTPRLCLTLLFTLSLAACATPPNNTNPVALSPAETTTFTNPVEPNTQVKDTKHGAETGLSICALSGVNGTLANGVATAYSFEDKGSIVGIQLNIAAAQDGSAYVAWIENTSKQRIRLGTLEHTGTDVRHSLRFDTNQDLSNDTIISITRETKNGADTGGPEVANGILKATKR